jgi:hypothetical protein
MLGHGSDIGPEIGEIVAAINEKRPGANPYKADRAAGAGRRG